MKTTLNISIDIETTGVLDDDVVARVYYPNEGDKK